MVHTCMGLSVTVGASSVGDTTSAGSTAPPPSVVRHCMRDLSAATGWLSVKLISDTAVMALAGKMSVSDTVTG